MKTLEQKVQKALRRHEKAKHKVNEAYERWVELGSAFAVERSGRGSAPRPLLPKDVICTAAAWDAFMGRQNGKFTPLKDRFFAGASDWQDKRPALRKVFSQAFGIKITYCRGLLEALCSTYVLPSVTLALMREDRIRRGPNVCLPWADGKYCMTDPAAGPAVAQAQLVMRVADNESIGDPDALWYWLETWLKMNVVPSPAQPSLAVALG